MEKSENFPPGSQYSNEVPLIKARKNGRVSPVSDCGHILPSLKRKLLPYSYRLVFTAEQKIDNKSISQDSNKTLLSSKSKAKKSMIRDIDTSTESLGFRSDFHDHIAVQEAIFSDTGVEKSVFHLWNFIESQRLLNFEASTNV